MGIIPVEVEKPSEILLVFVGAFDERPAVFAVRITGFIGRKDKITFPERSETKNLTSFESIFYIEKFVFGDYSSHITKKRVCKPAVFD